MIGLTPVEEDIRARSGADEPVRPPTERERYIDGLRILASVLEQNPGIPLPIQGHSTTLTMMFFGKDEDIREAMALAARAIPCDWKKRVSGGGEHGEYFDLLGTLGALRVELTAPREAVCKRVVTGTREVTEMVKDPEKLAEVPEIEVTRTEDVIEWDCGSLLAPRPAVAGEAPKAVQAA
jgi:hypothetical protein